MVDSNFNGNGVADGDTQARSAKGKRTRAQIGRAWLSRSQRDATEHAILGSTDLGYAIKHPIKSAAWLSGLAVSGLLAFAVLFGALHLLFGTPGSVRFAWDRPTTWFASGADVIRTPLVRMLGGTAERLDGDGSSGATADAPDGSADTSGYDADSFED